MFEQCKKIYQTRYKLYGLIVRSVLPFFSDCDLCRLVLKPIYIERFLGLSNVASLLLLHTNDEDILLTAAIYERLGATQSKYIAYLLADRMLRQRDYSKNTENLFKVATKKNCEINANFRFIDYLTQRNGFRTQILKPILRRLSSRRLYKHLTKLQRTRVLTLHLQQKELLRAKHVAKNLGRHYLEKNPGTLYLQHYATINGWVVSPHSQTASRMYRQLLRWRNKFEHLILRNPDGFCVIGNAPTEIGLGNGMKIDSFDVVIRMNDYKLTYPEDYGTKQTVWVRVANPEVTTDHSTLSELVIFASNNFATKRRDAYRYLLPLYLREYAYTAIPSHIYQELIRKLDALPSTGLAMLYWIYKLVGKIPRTQIFGFSHLSESRDFKSHYFESDSEIGVHLHEWNKETLLLNEITI